MKKIVVLSGKGGTGKTTLASFLSIFLKDSIKADCDVDAPNLNLVFNANKVYEKDFYGAKIATINYDECINCKLCKDYCRFDAIKEENNKIIIDDLSCEGCKACVIKCPKDAISLKQVVTGQVKYYNDFDSRFVGAKLEVGAEGSGKLVSKVKEVANKETKDEKYMIIDGSPGIGCSVIASITDTNYSIIVLEPTMSSIDDFKRLQKLLENFDNKNFVVINKYDLNEEKTNEIKEYCKKNNVDILGQIPFDKEMVKILNNDFKSILTKEFKSKDAFINIIDNLKNII